MKKIQKQDFKVVSVVIGILASVMIFLPALILKDSETSFTGFEVAFGHEFANLGTWASGEIAFNPLVALAYVLPLAGAIILMLTRKDYLLSTIMFIVAAILTFMIPQFTTTTVTLLGNVNEVDVEWTYGIGLILSGALSIMGALLGLVKLNKNL
jgi:hypothetical protein